MSHFKEVCECGITMSQCRCIGEKTIEVISPCAHNNIAATTGTITEPVSIEAFVKAAKKIEELGEIPNVMRCHPGVYNNLRLYFWEQEAKRRHELIEVALKLNIEVDIDALYKEDNPLLPYGAGSIYGCQIVIDNTMKVGEWRFERRRLGNND